VIQILEGKGGTKVESQVQPGKRGLLLTIAVLFLSLINIDVGLTNVAMGDIAKTFPNAGILISMVASLPIFIMIPVSIISGRMCYYFSKNSILITGLSLYVIGGMSGAFFNNTIYQILGSRAVLGIGAGMAAPMGTAVVGDLFDEVERAKLLGWSNSFGSIMAILMTFVAGALCVMNWKYTFLAYGVFALILFLQIIALPHMPPERTYKAAPVASEASLKGVVFSVFILVVSVISIMLLGSLLIFKLAIFIMERGIGDAITTANAFNFYSLGAIVSGVIFMHVYKKLNRYTAPVSIIGMSLVYFLIANAHSSAAIYLAMFLNGVAGGIFMPYIFTRSTMIGKKESKGLVIACVFNGLFLGQVLGTFVEPTLQFFFGQQSIAFLFNFGGIAYGILMVISFLWVMFTKETKAEGESTAPVGTHH
jgi:predicted MFS family arabinose efflux permease